LIHIRKSILGEADLESFEKSLGFSKKEKEWGGGRECQTPEGWGGGDRIALGHVMRLCLSLKLPFMTACIMDIGLA
jgi:hypothetical protein